MHITDAFVLTIDADPRQIAAAVFRTLSTFISRGEIEKVRQTLPAAVRQFWLDSLPRDPATQLPPSSRPARARRTKKVASGPIEPGEDIIL